MVRVILSQPFVNRPHHQMLVIKWNYRTRGADFQMKSHCVRFLFFVLRRKSILPSYLHVRHFFPFIQPNRRIKVCFVKQRTPPTGQHPKGLPDTSFQSLPQPSSWLKRYRCKFTPWYMLFPNHNPKNMKKFYNHFKRIVSRVPLFIIKVLTENAVSDLLQNLDIF